MTTSPTPQDIANAMYARDVASQALGISLVEVRMHYARLTMNVRSDMLNGHAICHGGFIFTLADSAFAFACNTTNIVTVAAGCDISFVAPAYENDILIAECTMQYRGGRSGVYDTIVRNKEQVIALFRGRSRQLKELVYDPKEEAK